MESNFEQQLSKVYGNIKRLPYYGQKSITYITTKVENKSLQEIKKTLEGIEGVTSVESAKAPSTIHIIMYGEQKYSIIYAPSEDLEWLTNYHSYSFSIIFGKILKRAGLKYSEDGLQYEQKNLIENHQSVIGRINITKDLFRILDVLRLSVDKFKEGFTSYKEMFDYVVTSPYFYAKMFVSENKEQHSVLLQKFEEYIILNDLENQEKEMITFEYVKTCFPEIDFQTLQNALLNRAEQKKSIHDKLNGRVILDSIPGFDPREIGPALTTFKKIFGSKEAYEDYMCDHSKEEILEYFKTLIK